MGCYNQYKARGCSYTECKSQHMLHTLALWGLVTNNGKGGGLQTAGGGRISEVLSLQKKGGADFFFSRAEGGGGTKSCEVVLTWELEILAIVIGGGGRKKFPPFKVRLWLLGVVSQYHGKIYSFHFSILIMMMIIRYPK